jgi:hypothetical protein
MQGRKYNAVKGQSWSPPCRQVPVNGERERGRPALRDLLWFQREVPELLNGVSDERDEELAYLVHALWKEDVGDQGRSLCTWVLLEDVVRALKDADLAVLDDFQETNPSQHWEDARAGFREAHAAEAEG